MQSEKNEKKCDRHLVRQKLSKKTYIKLICIK